MKVKHKVPEGMDDQELKRKAHQLAGFERERAALEQQAKDAQAGFRAKLKPIRKQIASLAEEVHSGQRMREMECEERFDITRKVVIVRRIDTGEVVEEIAEKDYDGPLVLKAMQNEATNAASKKSKKQAAGEKPRFQGKTAEGAVFEITETQFHAHQKAPDEDAMYYVGEGKQVRLVESWQVLPDQPVGGDLPPIEGDGAEHLRAVEAAGQLELGAANDGDKRRSRRRRA